MTPRHRRAAPPWCEVDLHEFADQVNTQSKAALTETPSSPAQNAGPKRWEARHSLASGTFKLRPSSAPQYLSAAQEKLRSQRVAEVLPHDIRFERGGRAPRARARARARASPEVIPARACRGTTRRLRGTALLCVRADDRDGRAATCGGGEMTLAGKIKGLLKSQAELEARGNNALAKFDPAAYLPPHTNWDAVFIHSPVDDPLKSTNTPTAGGGGGGGSKDDTEPVGDDHSLKDEPSAPNEEQVDAAKVGSVGAPIYLAMPFHMMFHRGGVSHYD